jgi:hypothetical protein
MGGTIAFACMQIVAHPSMLSMGFDHNYLSATGT